MTVASDSHLLKKIGGLRPQLQRTIFPGSTRLLQPEICEAPNKGGRTFLSATWRVGKPALLFPATTRSSTHWARSRPQRGGRSRLRDQGDKRNFYGIHVYGESSAEAGLGMNSTCPS